MGQIPKRYNITNITSLYPCEVTLSEEPDFVTGDFVRLTDLNGNMPVNRGMDQLNNYRFRIIMTDVNKFMLQDPITLKIIDSSTFPAYVTGGSCNLVERHFIYYDDGDNDG